MLVDVPAYGQGDPAAFLTVNSARFTADGMAPQEVTRAVQALRSWEDWWPYWMQRSTDLADMSEHPGGTRPTRTGFLLQAMLAAHLAQYLHFDRPDERETALRMKIALYHRALAATTDRSAHLLEVPFGGGSLPAILRLPAGADFGRRCPVVVYVGGLDAHKEDSHAFGDLCLDRGLGIVAVDGPGQGEAFLRGQALGEDAHASVSAVIETLRHFPGVDVERIGVIGRSLGGYLAPRAAADEPRIRALVVWGAMWDLTNFTDLPSHTRAGFRTITRSADDAEAAIRTRFIALEAHAGRIFQPTLIVHGELDTLTPPAGARALAAAIGSSCRVDILAGSGHCNHDVAHVVRPRMADFLTAALREGAAGVRRRRQP